MRGKMKKNGFVEGAVIAYVAIVITKILGAFYNIPFYQIIGERGSIIYSFAYNIYVLFLDISTSGIPIAISIVISEYATKGMYKSKEKAYKLGLQIVVAVSLVAFSVLMIFAEGLASFYIADMTDGVTVKEVAAAIRAVSFCLLIVPFLSMKRGYLQGHKCLGASSTSQVIEQIVRIVFVLGGASLVVYGLNLGTAVGACIALVGASVGAGAALVYLMVKSHQSKELFVCEVEETPDSTKEILKKIFTYCISIVLVSVSTSIYGIVDMKLLLVGLHDIGYSAVDTQTVASIACTWIPKICMIVVALSMGLTNSIAPHMAESFSQGRMKEVGLKLNQGIGTIIVVSTPMAVGIAMLSQPVYNIFYGESDYGPQILAVSIIMNVVASVVAVVSMAMQSIDCGKQVIIFTLVGVAVNAGLDLPFIYLYNNLGVPPYLGATTASIIGEVVTLLLLLITLYRKHKISYKPSLMIMVKILLPLAALILAVYGLKLVWPVIEKRGLLLVLQMAVYAVVGAAVYGFLALKLGAIKEVIEEEKINSILRKLHLKK